MSPGERGELVKPDHSNLSLSAQCRVLNISRSTLYYRPMGESTETHQLDEGNRQAVHEVPVLRQSPDRSLVGTRWH